MATSKKTLIIIGAVVAVVAVVLIVLIAAGASSQAVDKDDAAKTLDDLGYSDADIKTCDYVEGYNAFNVKICKLSGTFVSKGTEHTYDFSYTMSGSSLFTQVDGGYVYVSDTPGACTYNFAVSKEMSSFTYKGYSGTTYTDTADAGMKYVVVDFIAKNVSYNGTLSPTAGSIKCVTSSNLSYSYSSDTSNYTGINTYEFPDLAVGGTYKFTLLFEIPQGDTISDIIHEYNSLYGWKLDSTLAV